jgi:hypothetical protein
MSAAVLGSIFWGVIVVILLARFVPDQLPPWQPIDQLFCRIVNRARGALLLLPHDSYLSNRSSEVRIALFKQFTLGIAVLLIFPYHNLSRTDYIIDQIWKVIVALREMASNLVSPDPFVGTHGWREAEYELWELCVVIWTISFFLEMVFQELADASEGMTSSRFASRVRRFIHLKTLVLVLGVLFLVMLDNPLLRLLFELLVVTVMSIFHLYYCRHYARRNRLDAGREVYQLLVLADLPAVCAFVVLIVFVVLNQDRDPLLRSTWMTAFVSGASALNLLLASGTALTLKLIQENAHMSGRGRETSPRRPHA